MYFGTNEKLKKKIREFNDNSDYFIFSQGDLEPNLNEISGKKNSIFSSELRQKLGEIISQQKKPEDNIFSSPAFIEAQMSLDSNKANNVSDHTILDDGLWLEKNIFINRLAKAEAKEYHLSLVKKEEIEIVLIQ